MLAMPIIASAKKALRASKRKRVYNIRRKDAMSFAVKAVRKAIAAKDEKKALTLLPVAFKALDKASKTKYVKKNTANRLKSRLAKAVAKIK